MSATAVSVFEYLHTAYRPDVDYIDGEIEERNLGEYDHARLQGLVYGYLLSREKEWNTITLPEQRVQVSPTRFRIPDIIVVRQRPKTGIVTEPPLLCIEILSPEDTHRRLQARIDDYLGFGVPFVWVIDPERRRGWIYTRESAHDAPGGVLIADEIRVPLAELGE